MRAVEPVTATPAVRPVESTARPPLENSGMHPAPPAEVEVSLDRNQLLWEIMRDLGIEGKDLTKVELRYSIHQESGRPMVVVRNRETMEIMRTVPPEQLLNVVARIIEYVGLLMDETV